LNKIPDMEIEFYKKLIDQCPSVHNVQPQGIGEPLMYPDIVEAVSYAASAKKYVFFYTNGSLMNNTMAQSLLSAGISEVRFSVDGRTKKGYESLRRGLKWETVLGNIENFQKLKAKKGYKCSTQVRITKTKENSKSINQIVTFWKKRVDKVQLEYEDVVLSSTQINKRKWISGKCVLASRCMRPWNHITIKANGDMIPCCKDWYGDYVMGNVYETSILEAFNSNKFNSVRSALRKNENYPIICLYCKTSSKR